MELRLSGLRFTLEPEAELSRQERGLLRPWACAPDDARPDLRLRLERAPAAAAAAPAPAEVTADGEGLRVSHATFEAWLDPTGGAGVVRRRQSDGGALLITLRVALSALLPLRGGLPLHAAGIVQADRGLVFFGPSGAGKSTLAATARDARLAVLSDEQVSLLLGPPRLLASGFWGELDGPAGDAAAPLAALIELDRGPRVSLTRLAPDVALRRLLGVLLVPPQAGLWSRALGVAGRLVREVPVYRLAWSPAEPPWDELHARLRADAEPAASEAEVQRG